LQACQDQAALWRERQSRRRSQRAQQHVALDGKVTLDGNADFRHPGRADLVDERTELTTKLYEIELAGATNIAGSRWDDAATRPTLEQSAVAAAGIVPLKKTLRFDTADHPEVVGKTEGMTLLGDGALALINDDDFGISGARTQIAVVRGTGIARR
jgi:hypothetical protein